MNEIPLVGWKEISAAFGESQWTTIRKYKKSLKSNRVMPIYKNGRIKAFYSELRVWLSYEKNILKILKKDKT